MARTREELLEALKKGREERARMKAAGIEIPKKKLSITKAVRAHCKDCSGGSFMEVKLCPVKDCELYDFRIRKSRGVAETLEESNDSEDVDDLEEELVELESPEDKKEDQPKSILDEDINVDD